MRYCLHAFMVAMIGVVCVHTADADIFVASADGSLTVGGTTFPIEGSAAGLAGSSDNWSNTNFAAGDGTDFQGDFGGTQGNGDWYFIINDPSDFTGISTIANSRYVEVFYSLSSDVSVSGAAGENRHFLSDTGQGNNGENPTNDELIPATAGSHRVVLDLLSSDGSTLDGDFSGAQSWDQFRWDPWNDSSTRAANVGTTFTLDKIVYGSEIVAIPEPSSFAMLGLGIFGLVSRRRK